MPAPPERAQGVTDTPLGRRSAVARRLASAGETDSPRLEY